jgi:transcriptional repressor NrdR
VRDSRAVQDGFATRRRRECTACRHRYTTYERIENTVVKLIKKSGIRQPFDRTKIKRGLEIACRKRPISDAQLEVIVNEIQNDLENRAEPEIESREVGELVMQQLRALDQVAYVRFASVYRQFEDVHDFVHELKSMLAEARRRDEDEDDEDDDNDDDVE